MKTLCFFVSRISGFALQKLFHLFNSKPQNCARTGQQKHSCAAARLIYFLRRCWTRFWDVDSFYEYTALYSQMIINAQHVTLCKVRGNLEAPYMYLHNSAGLAFWTLKMVQDTQPNSPLKQTNFGNILSQPGGCEH